MSDIKVVSRGDVCCWCRHPFENNVWAVSLREQLSHPSCAKAKADWLTNAARQAEQQELLRLKREKEARGAPPVHIVTAMPITKSFCANCFEDVTRQDCVILQDKYLCWDCALLTGAALIKEARLIRERNEEIKEKEKSDGISGPV